MNIVEIAPEFTNQILICAKDMHQESVYRDRPFDEKRARALIANLCVAYTNKHKAFLAVTDDAEVVGFIAVEIQDYFFTNSSGAADIAFYVKPSWRMGGAALGLISAAEAWAKEQGAADMTLGVSAPKDYERVANFYMKLGYVLNGQTTIRTL